MSNSSIFDSSGNDVLESNALVSHPDHGESLQLSLPSEEALASSLDTKKFKEEKADEQLDEVASSLSVSSESDKDQDISENITASFSWEAPPAKDDQEISSANSALFDALEDAQEKSTPTTLSKSLESVPEETTSSETEDVKGSNNGVSKEQSLVTEKALTKLHSKDDRELAHLRSTLNRLEDQLSRMQTVLQQLVAQSSTGNAHDTDTKHYTVSDILAQMDEKMQEGSLNKEQILLGLRKLEGGVLRHKHFPKALLKFVSSKSDGDRLLMTDIKKYPELTTLSIFSKANTKKTWTFRYYANTQSDILQSPVLLEVDHIAKNESGNNDQRWGKLGHQGYVSGLICIDGEAPDRSWIPHFTYYAEYDLKHLDQVWISGDLFNSELEGLPSYEGPGEMIIQYFSNILGVTDQDEAKRLDDQFQNTLQAKVAPALLSKPVWNKNNTSKNE